ncbi:vacuolar protein sorting-associated protein 37A [Anoplophora glabripennis]|uniref:vacuolar protein sorting-associated protein 37A n=1 Tax=Anoplophora glabripennis TaxID=217634 RepID=UPI000874205E|nr:vacuolar protein sorting-associated protein 37A [Anoplophora glabripennis]
MLPRLFKTEADLRKHQINTLKIFNDNVVEITEGEEYEISFNSGVNKLCLKITLSKEFPKEKPILKIVPEVVHHWVGSDGQIKSAPGLLNFTVHSDLGRVVQAIIREFQRTPPPLVSNHSSNIVSPTLDSEKRTSPINFHSSFSTIKSFSPPPHMPQPSFVHQTVPFPELANMSLEELQLLNENIDMQDDFVNELPQIKEQNKHLDDVIVQVEELAEANLSKQNKLNELKSNIDSKIEHVTKLAFENGRLHAIYQNFSDKFSPRNIKEQLRLGAEKADLDCEKIADRFLNGEIDVDRFVNDFIKTKALCQTRKTKEEKLSYQLDKLDRAGF